MRLGEIKQKLDLVVNESKVIILNSEMLYNNQVYKIKNYKLIIDALKSVKDMEWVDQDFSLVQEIINKKSSFSEIVDLDQAEFNQINSYISTLNQKIPIFLAMLNSVVVKQDEKIINIKLPQEIKTILELSELNKRLDDILKLYNLDGQFDFKEFDKGTDWYVIIATGQLSYWAMVGGLNIANKFFEIKKTYYDSKTSEFNSKTAELEYRAATDKEKITEDDLKKYVEKKLQLQVEQEVTELSDKIDNTNNKIENLVKILKATKKLIKELETEEFEFHLSLNPPKNIVSESGGVLTIQYDNLPKIEGVKKEVKKIESKKADEHKKSTKE